MLKDSSAKAFMNHLRKVIDQSDVIIQVCALSVAVKSKVKLNWTVRL